MSGKARKAIIQLAAAEMVRTVADATEREKTARAAKSNLRSGHTIERVFRIAFDAVKAAGDKMVDAHLSTRFFASDATIASEVRPELEPFLRDHLKAEGKKGYVTADNHWAKATDELWPEAQEYFDLLEAYVAQRRHLSTSTRVDHALRAVKSYPVPAAVLFVAIAIGAGLGWAKNFKDWVDPAAPCLDTHVTGSPATGPAPATPRPAGKGP